MLNKDEEISVSFHYLVREDSDKSGDRVLIPITKAEFAKIYKKLEDCKGLSLDDEDVINRVRSRRVAPIKKLEKKGDNVICGLFEASYWGHEYNNNIRGTIPMDSVSFRSFFFYLYLSKSGRVYVSAQYLGAYGGYTQLRNTIVSALEKNSQIDSLSFNVSNFDLDKADARSIEIKYSRKSENIASGNSIGKRGALILSPQNEEDTQKFAKSVRNKILDKLPFSSAGRLRKTLSEMLKNSDLLELVCPTEVVHRLC